MKIRILGGPGSGKSHLARELSQILHIEYHDLDYVRYDDSDKFVARDKKERAKILQKLVLKKDWIMEGVYGTQWTYSTYEKADIIIILHVNRYKRIYRILKRSIKAHLGIIKAKKDTLKQLLEFLRWNWSYEQDDLPKIEAEIKHYTRRRKTLIFTSADEALDYFKKRQ